MKVVADENVQQAFIRELDRLLAGGGGGCVHAAAVGFAGLGNGALQDATLAAGYDALVTSDLNMPFQTTPRLPVLVMPAMNEDAAALIAAASVAGILAGRNLAERYHAVRPGGVSVSRSVREKISRIETEQLVARRRRS